MRGLNELMEDAVCELYGFTFNAAVCDWNGCPIKVAVIDGKMRWDVVDIFWAMLQAGVSRDDQEAFLCAIEDNLCFGTIWTSTRSETFIGAVEDAVVRILSAVSNPAAVKFLRWMRTMSEMVQAADAAAEACEYLESQTRRYVNTSETGRRLL